MKLQRLFYHGIVHKNKLLEIAPGKHTAVSLKKMWQKRQPTDKFEIVKLKIEVI